MKQLWQTLLLHWKRKELVPSVSTLLEMERVKAPFCMDRLSTDMHESCLHIDKECRVLTVHGSADETVPVGCRRCIRVFKDNTKPRITCYRRMSYPDPGPHHIQGSIPP